MNALNVNMQDAKPRGESEEELMDVEEAEVDGCYEEGEINSDDEKNSNVRTPIIKYNIFSRNNDLSSGSAFGTDEGFKKLDRAKRFSIPVRNNEVTEVQQDQLLSLYRDLGIDKENERHYRFNAIHMRGTENMSTEDVMEYFAEFSPSYVEWINDVSCNVVWMDDIASARAFLNLSKRIKNLDKVHSNADPFEKDFKSDSPFQDPNVDDSVDARSIKTAIPPGYWRLGVPCEKNQYVLLRYATRSDKKQKFAEKNSEYYRKYGNPHFGNIPGLISSSRRAQLKRQRQRRGDDIWRRKEPETGKKNPWEDLAYEWGVTEKVEDTYYNPLGENNLDDDLVKSDVPDLRISLSNRKAKAKRLREDFDASPNSSDKETWESKSKVPRMKMYADEEEEKLEKIARLGNRGRLKANPISDLRNKINLKKKEAKSKFRFKKKSRGDPSELSGSENDYDDGDSGEWALEQYHDLRESLGQSKRSGRQRHNLVKYDSESEEDLSESFEEKDLSRRSPLQVEIENDECLLNKK